MKTKNLYLTAVLLLAMALTACAGKVTDENRSLQLPATTISSIAIENTSGDLTVEGIDGLEKIEAVATIRRSTGPDTVTFQLTENNGQANLITGFDRPFTIVPVVQSIEVVVKVPKQLKISIQDDSGNLRINNVDGHVEINDQSGNMDVHGIGGVLDIIDDSGDITLSDVFGATSVTDQSGNFDAVDIQGELTLHDQSGNISIARAGNTVVITDASGDIDVKGVAGDLILQADTSGNFTYEGISGELVMPK